MKKRQDHARQDHPLEAAGAFATYLRIGIIGLLVLIQLALMWAITYFLRTNAAFLYIFFDIVALFTVVSLINRHDSSAYRIAWLVIVLTIPIFGLLLYFAWGRVDFNKKEKGAFKESFMLGFSLLPQAKPMPGRAGKTAIPCTTARPRATSPAGRNISSSWNGT